MTFEIEFKALNGFPIIDGIPVKPKNFDIIIDLARNLSKEKFVRGRS